MNIDWSDLVNALALLLIFEGLLPFISPSQLKKVYAQIQTYPEKTLRMFGLICVIAGILLLFLTD
ncbi:MAG TPA: DUF2065 domain-containing protein [Thiolinea sp.]|nr:DUF2065 domain-containing protein [Thiolinea sp.]